MAYVDDGRCDFSRSKHINEHLKFSSNLVQDILALIEKSGISAYDAKNIPHMLSDEITSQNCKNLGNINFKVFPKEPLE